ncbi:hypothetical protein ASD00_36965 [Ensifer sp. Root31]|nr:hypothetical protein ASD00_36965 [Ensifer sp. Root31]
MPTMFEVRDAPDRLDDIPWRQPIDNRRARARRIGRIDAVDVERKVARHFAHGFLDFIHQTSRSEITRPRAKDNVDLIVHCVMSPDADLDGVLRTDNVLFHGISYERAMVQIFGPGGVAMRIELNKRHRSVDRRVRFQHGVSYRMITSKGNQSCSRFQDQFGLLLDILQHLSGLSPLMASRSKGSSSRSDERQFWTSWGPAGLRYRPWPRRSPHPKRDIPIGTLKIIEKQADLKLR